MKTRFTENDDEKNRYYLLFFFPYAPARKNCLCPFSPPYMQRGNCRTKAFITDEDHQAYLCLLKRCANKYEPDILA